ncbi:MAG TPA: hypothetical protein VK186_00880, partial [Candidatus Deferrimicrobium sp.]|nr:hypothetical protein [Candidatus Deferrimicrobium sp.]
MELKDIITISSFFIAAGGLIVAILAYRSKKKLQLENLKLQHEMLEFQKEKEDKGELKEKIEEFKGKLEKGSNRDIYCHHIRQKFKYLDFTGLNAILQKPLLLESIYVKLKAKPSYRLSDYHSIADFNQLGAEGKEKQTEKEKDKNN